MSTISVTFEAASALELDELVASYIRSREHAPTSGHRTVAPPGTARLTWTELLAWARIGQRLRSGWPDKLRDLRTPQTLEQLAKRWNTRPQGVGGTIRQIDAAAKRDYGWPLVLRAPAREAGEGDTYVLNPDLLASD